MNPNWAIAAVLAVISGAIFIALHLRRADQVIAAAIARTQHSPERQAPGTDTDLLIDAALAYYGPTGLQRLSDAINQTREETP